MKAHITKTTIPKVIKFPYIGLHTKEMNPSRLNTVPIIEKSYKIPKRLRKKLVKVKPVIKITFNFEGFPSNAAKNQIEAQIVVENNKLWIKAIIEKFIEGNKFGIIKFKLLRKLVKGIKENVNNSLIFVSRNLLNTMMII